MRTALILPVPEAEEAVGVHRSRWDRAAGWGIPAHITVLYPFLPPDRIDDEVLTALRAVVASVPGAAAVLTRIGWFGDRVVWLAPSPGHLFRELTLAVWRRFPEAAPYGGEFPDIVPHLTVGHDAGRAQLARAGAEVAVHLPIAFVPGPVRLIAGTPDREPWRTVAEFPLGAPRRAGEQPDRSGGQW